MNRPPIDLGTFHHVYNRGTEKRLIFMSDADRLLFLKYLVILNDADIESPSRNMANPDAVASQITRRLAYVCAFCLMPNHFHMVLYEATKGGISKFMQRLGTAYTMYFNEKYERSGALFQGGFKSKEVDEEAYLMKLIDYVHLNPVQHKDHEGNKSMRGDALTILDSYPWSSYSDYCGRGKHATAIQKDILEDYLEMPTDYRAWLEEEHDFDGIGHLMIDQNLGKNSRKVRPYAIS